MRRRLAAVFLTLLPLATLVVACASSNGDDDADESSDALRRRDVEPSPPVPKPKPDSGIKPPIAPIGPGVLAPPEPWCGETRFDLRRVTRTCEELPHAFVENGTTYIPGTNGRFKVERTLAGTSAPEEAKSKTCSYVWQPAKCGALPDTDKLLIESPKEQIVPRLPGCQYLPPTTPGCYFVAPLPQMDGSIPTGLGRCEVCGFAANDHMWAILPSEWTSFSYWAAGQRRFVQLSSSQDVYDTGLPSSVSAQDVPIYPKDTAPQ
jgi:hypothetical protein